MKLSINPLLHLVSVSALGGIVMSFLEFRENENRFKADSKVVATDIKRLSEAAISPRQEAGRWDYSKKGFWENFAQANFTGKVKKVEVPRGDDTPTKSAGPADAIDLNEVLTVIAITRGAERTGAVVNYTATVEVPKEFQVAPSTGVVGNASTIPKGRLNSVGAFPTASPGASAGAAPPHHLKIGDHLWPPYAHVYLQKVAVDASAVVFEKRVSSTKEGDAHPTQEILKNELGLPVEVLESLRTPGGKTGDAVKSKGDEATPTPAAGPDYTWRPTKDTEVDRNNNVNVGVDDDKWLRENGDRVFSEDVAMRDYSARIGNTHVQGVQFNKLSPRLRRFGVNEGDVVISINNQPVKGMAHAKRLGTRLYQSGVRSFKAVVLRRGEQQVLTFHMQK